MVLGSGMKPSLDRGLSEPPLATGFLSPYGDPVYRVYVLPLGTQQATAVTESWHSVSVSPAFSLDTLLSRHSADTFHLTLTPADNSSHLE